MKNIKKNITYLFLIGTFFVPLLSYALQSNTFMVVSLKHSLSTNKFTLEDVSFSNEQQFGDLRYAKQYELRELDSASKVLYKRTFAVSHERQLESFGDRSLSSALSTVGTVEIVVPIQVISRATRLAVINQSTGAEELSYDISGLMKVYKSVGDIPGSLFPSLQESIASPPPVQSYVVTGSDVNPSLVIPTAQTYKKTISQFNAESQRLYSDIIDSRNGNFGTIDINFPKNSLYNVGGSPTINFEAITNTEINQVISVDSPLQKIPSSLQQLTDYVFGIQVLSSINQDILRSNIPMKLQLNDITDTIRWQGAKLYQYYCINRTLIGGGCYQFAWIPVSNTAAISGQAASFDALTKDTRLGLFAIFGNK